MVARWRKLRTLRMFCGRVAVDDRMTLIRATNNVGVLT